MSSIGTQGRSVSGSKRSRAAVRLGGPLVGAAVVAAALFLALTVGVQQLTATEAGDFTHGRGYLPEVVHDPPETVKTTDEYGPPGPVSLVFAVGVVEAGLTGALAHPWIAVSSQTGDYRALVAPHLPPPAAGAMAVSPDGGTLGWAYPEGVVVYDTLENTAREVPLDAGSPVTVGRFSPDGHRLTAYAGGVLHVVDLEQGDIVGRLPNLGARAARQAIWTPDGGALTYVAHGRLITRPWAGGPAEHAPAGIAVGATLDWHPSGARLAAVQTASTGSRVRLFDVDEDGDLEPARTLARPSYSMQRMLGFSSETTVSAIGLGLATGALPQLYRMSTESPVVTDVAQLPADGRVVRTLAVAAGPLQNGSSPFPEPDWPISDRAKLVISGVVSVFVVGLFLTRRPRARREAGHAHA